MTHQIQMTEIWAQHFAVRRRSRRDSDATAPLLNAGGSRFRGQEAEGKAFTCSITFRVLVPVFEDEVFDANMEIAGSFASADDSPLPLNVARVFAHRQAPYLLWPFARSFLHQFALAAGAAIPPLPLIVFPPDRRFRVETAPLDGN